MAHSAPAGGHGKDGRYAEFPRGVAAVPGLPPQRIESADARDVCEVGGGANPAVSLEDIDGLRYTILDVSAEELAEAPNAYRKLEADVSSRTSERGAVRHRLQPDGARARHRSAHVPPQRLRDPAHGGVAFHFFPTLYARVRRQPPASSRLVEAALLRLQPHRDRGGVHGKFPACTPGAAVSDRA